jgi:hypothetical protein
MRSHIEISDLTVFSAFKLEVVARGGAREAGK